MDKVQYVKTLLCAHKAIEGDMHKPNSYLASANRKDVYLAANSLYNLILAATDGVNPDLWLATRAEEVS